MYKMEKNSYAKKQKNSIMKWRNSNTDKYNTYMNDHLKTITKHTQRIIVKKECIDILLKKNVKYLGIF